MSKQWFTNHRKLCKLCSKHTQANEVYFFETASMRELQFLLRETLIPLKQRIRTQTYGQQLLDGTETRCKSEVLTCAPTLEAYHLLIDFYNAQESLSILTERCMTESCRFISEMTERGVRFGGFFVSSTNEHWKPFFFLDYLEYSKKEHFNVANLHFFVQQPQLFHTYWNCVYVYLDHHLGETLTVLRPVFFNHNSDCWNIVLSFTSVSVTMMIDTLHEHILNLLEKLPKSIQNVCDDKQGFITHTLARFVQHVLKELNL